MSSSLEIVFAEFGPGRANAGGGALPVERLEPSLSSFLKAFPEATAVVYTDQPWESRDRVRVVQVDPPFDKAHERFGWRANDWGQPYGALQSKADVVMWADSDLLIVNDDVRTIIPIVTRFQPGVAAAPNGRHLCWRDASSTLDGGAITDDSRGMATCHCTAFMAFDSRNDDGRRLLQAYCDQIVDDANNNRGARGPLSFWRACWQTGLAPYTLPQEWTITGSNLGSVDAKGRVVPAILHVGHETVSRHYASLVEKWR